MHTTRATDRMNIVLRLLELFFAVGIPFALLRALLPPRGAGAERRTRRRAQWLTVFFGLVVTYLLLVVLRALTGSEGPNPLGLVPFLLLCGAVAAGAAVLLWAWRSARVAARVSERPAPLHPAAAAPAPLAPPSRHRALTGEEPPPTRW